MTRNHLAVKLVYPDILVVIADILLSKAQQRKHQTKGRDSFHTPEFLDTTDPRIVPATCRVLDFVQTQLRETTVRFQRSALQPPLVLLVAPSR